MNSMNKVAEELKIRFNIEDFIYPDDMQMIFDVDKDMTHTVLDYLKGSGFRQLSILTCIDWPKENVFQLVYIIFNWDTGIHVLLRTKLDRDKPEFRTITNIYPGAQYYERDVHEFFGVEFEGNEMSYKPLFLELWDDIPPMRKDFDPLAYSKKRFPEREYKVNFTSKAGGDE